MLRWSPTAWRKVEAARDRATFGLGTEEEWFTEELTRVVGPAAIAVHWRKPLRIDEVNLLAPTAEVRERPGRVSLWCGQGDERASSIKENAFAPGLPRLRTLLRGRRRGLGRFRPRSG